MKSNEKNAIETFVKTRADSDIPGLRVVAWPDDEPGADYEIDAVAENSTTKLAIEHTTIDAVNNQRRDGTWFEAFIGDLEQEFKGKLGATFQVVFGYRDVQPGSDWTRARNAVRCWLTEQAPELRDGDHTVNLDALPFPLSISKDSTLPSSLQGVLFLRTQPPDLCVSFEESVENGLPVPPSMASHMQRQMANKASKLGRYQGLGYRTVLVLENWDMGLMNDLSARKGVQLLSDEGHLTGIDEVWYVDTSYQGLDGPVVNVSLAELTCGWRLDWPTI